MLFKTSVAISAMVMASRVARSMIVFSSPSVQTLNGHVFRLAGSSEDDLLQPSVPQLPTATHLSSRERSSTQSNFMMSRFGRDKDMFLKLNGPSDCTRCLFYS